jgi:hypothetical protein
VMLDSGLTIENQSVIIIDCNYGLWPLMVSNPRCQAHA